MSTASSRYIFEILRLVSTEKRPMSATEISRRLRLSTTTAHRGLQTLERAGYVARHQLSARYVLGGMSRRLLQSFFARFALHGFAIPYMRQLAIATGETASLFVRVGWYAVRIASVQGTKEIIHTGPTGEVRDLDRTLRDAVQYKFTASQLTQQDIAGLFDILYKPPAK